MVDVELIFSRQNGIIERTLDSLDEAILVMQRIGERELQQLREHKRLTIDMDGVLIHDDNGVTATEVMGGEEARQMFSYVAQQNLRAVEQTAYCWYAPTVFFGRLCNGLSPEINREVGRHMRLTPSAEMFTYLLTKNGYDITSVTAGVQEAAEEVSARVGINKTIGTSFGQNNGLYNGTLTRFIGGQHKLYAVAEILGQQNHAGGHLGDSWSDIETLAAVSDSIAYNPGCEQALRAAKISVISQSLTGLLPLFGLPLTDLPPEIVFVNERGVTPPADLITYLFEASRKMKKQVLPAYLDNEKHPYEVVLKKIKKALQDIPHQTQQLPPKKGFEEMAIRLFKEYEKTGPVKLE